MMKSTYLFFVITILTISCRGQIVSLETVAQCMYASNPQPCPTFNYAKDINNSLNKYVGTWKGSKNGKMYEFNFIKKEYAGDYGIKKDFLVGRLQVKDTNGNIIYNTLNETDDKKTFFSGFNFQSDLKAYVMNFSGPTAGCNEFGSVYLVIKPATPNQMGVLQLQDK